MTTTPKADPSTLHPDLLPLLAKHGLTIEDFHRRGRLPPDKAHVLERRRDLVTDLHAAGKPWAEMTAITGLGFGTLNRLTRAVGNEASHRNKVESAAAVGRSRKGEEKPWLAERMRKAWDAGMFDLHFDRVRSDEEIAKWKAAKHGRRGITEWVDTQKGGRILTRSRMEKIAAARLDVDPQVTSFEYERPIRVGTRVIFPDFIAHYVDGSTTLIEIKPTYVFRLDDAAKTEARLETARQVAAQNGWAFTLWTEQNLDPSPHRKRQRPPAPKLPLGDSQDPVRST